MMQSRTSHAEPIPVNVVIVTMDTHLSSAVDRARVSLKQQIPGLNLTLHAASEWSGKADRLEHCLEDIAKGDIVIVEVKSSAEDYLTDRKWGEYAPYCDAFYFAVAPHFPVDLLPVEPGLIVADGFGGAVVRDAPLTPLVAARRKALTLAFARLAAFRR